ncbi:MAG: alpha/beta hydrolase fold domain-containing protein [Spirosomataceae bacterium]
MKKLLFAFTIISLVKMANAQSFPIQPLGKPDTSFNNNSAFRQIKSKYPDASHVNLPTNENIVIEKNIKYVKIGKRELELDVFYPKAKSSKKRVGVLIIHGGGWRTGNRTQHYALAQRMAEHGYVAITAEYRLSTEALYPAAVHDLKTAIRWMRKNAKNYQIDDKKIVAMGYSAGGQLAALIGNTNKNAKFEGDLGYNEYSSDANAIIDLDGILAFIHPESGEGDDSKSISAATYWFGYNKTTKPELWNEGSALTYAGKDSPPTLFINSSVPRMHAGREDYIAKLNQYKIYTEVHTYDDAPHTFVLFNPWFEPIVKNITGFIDKVFK